MMVLHAFVLFGTLGLLGIFLYRKMLDKGIKEKYLRCHQKILSFDSVKVVNF